MKFSATLTNQAEQLLDHLVEEHNAKVSTIIEAALIFFGRQPTVEREKLLRDVHATKKAYTKGRWRAAFWEAMREEFWLPGLPQGRHNDFAPLTFVGFQLWFLTDSISDPDLDDFPYLNLHITSNPMESRYAQTIQWRLEFPRDRSPRDAAREIAGLLREQAIAAGVLEFLTLADNSQVLIDHSGGHWMAQPTIDPSKLPITVTGHYGSYRLDHGGCLRRTVS